MLSYSAFKETTPEVLSPERIQLPPLTIEWFAQEKKGTVGAASFSAEVRWEKQALRFAARYSRQMTPKAFAIALQDTIEKARQAEAAPLLIVPYLSEERLRLLEERGISGLDLCGNGLVTVPNHLFVLRSGARNRFSTSVPIKAIYQKTSSLVGRVMLLRPRYGSVGEVQKEIEKRGGKISLATVSRILKALEEELIVDREEGGVRILQPDKLLLALTTAFERLVIRRIFHGKVALPQEEIPAALAEAAHKENVPFVVTGEGSVGKYAVMATARVVACYCSSYASLLRHVPVVADTLFPNLTVEETTETTVYFDTRTEQGVPWASPLQTYLELMQGEKRDKETAEQVKALLLRQREEGNSL